MAGSYHHIKSGWSLIENMGDAHECVEQLYYLVRYFGTDREIEAAVEQYYRFVRGDDSPQMLHEHNGSEISDMAQAYLDAQEVNE